MVFFCCNYCGESVKKLSVEKHYNFVCRGATKNLSCMDCQKDFHGEDYVAHIRCITEAEKYSGKDYVAKEPKNSGQKKQESWMDIIRSILDTKEYNLNNQTRAAFQKLQTVDNVPRKKAKFQNFVENCMRMRKDQAEQVWCILEKELEKLKASKSSASPVINGTKEIANGEEPTAAVTLESKEADNNPTEDQPVITRVKKSKKRKVDKEIQNTIEQDEETEILQTATELADKVNSEPSKKKKKKKSDKSDARKVKVNAEQETTVSTTTPDEFQWGLVMLCTVRKYGNSMKLDKLKRKVQRMYLSKRKKPALTEKQLAKFEKKFSKHLKKCNLKVEKDVVSVVAQIAVDK